MQHISSSNMISYRIGFMTGCARRLPGTPAPFSSVRGLAKRRDPQTMVPSLSFSCRLFVCYILLFILCCFVQTLVRSLRPGLAPARECGPARSSPTPGSSRDALVFASPRRRDGSPQPHLRALSSLRRRPSCSQDSHLFRRLRRNREYSKGARASFRSGHSVRTSSELRKTHERPKPKRWGASLLGIKNRRVSNPPKFPGFVFHVSGASRSRRPRSLSGDGLRRILCDYNCHYCCYHYYY